MNVESIIQLIYADKLLTKLRKKIEAGQGTFKDTTDYCNRSAELLGRLFSENVLSMSDVERITANDTLLKDRYKDINDLLDKVQRTVDKKQGINIRPQHAPFNQERADQIGRALTDKTVSEETIQRRAGSAPATMTRAMQVALMSHLSVSVISSISTSTSRVVCLRLTNSKNRLSYCQVPRWSWRLRPSRKALTV